MKRNEERGRPLYLTLDETDAYVKKEVPRWTALLKAAGIGPGDHNKVDNIRVKRTFI